MEDSSSLLLIGLVVIVAILTVLYFLQRKNIHALRQQMEMELRAKQQEIGLLAKQQYDNWRTREIEAIRQEQREIALREAGVVLDKWKSETESFFRTDAVDRSRSVIVGKVTEHLIPFQPDFKFNPKEARFIGSPIDLLVFDGLDDGELRNVFFIEVKTGASAALSTRQRQIRDAIQAGRVKWIELRMDR